MTRIILAAYGLEFQENGNTIWVQGPMGTLLRIQCSGQVKVKPCDAPGAHADVFVSGDIEICVPVREPAPAPAPGEDARGAGRRIGRAPTVRGDLRAVGRRSGAVPASLAVVRRSPAAGAAGGTGTGKAGGRRAGRRIRSPGPAGRGSR